MTHKVTNSNFSIHKYTFGEHGYAHWPAYCLAVFMSTSMSDVSSYNGKTYGPGNVKYSLFGFLQEECAHPCVDHPVLQPPALSNG